MYVCGNFSEQIHYLMQVNQLSPNLQLFWSNSFMVDLFDKYDIYYWTSYQLDKKHSNCDCMQNQQKEPPFQQKYDKNHMLQTKQ